MIRIVWVSLMTGLVLGSCVARDKAVSRTEAPPTSPDISAPTADASVELSDGGDPSWAAMLKEDAAAIPVTVEPSRPPVDRLAECKALAEDNCRRRPEGELSWDAPPPASKTPEGRKCLQGEHARCAEQEKRAQKTRRLVEWLDGQLVPGKLDEEYTKSVRARIDEEVGVLGDALDFACTPQFCRMKLKPGTYSPRVAAIQHFVDGGGALRRFEPNGPSYMPRKGFVFPR